MFDRDVEFTDWIVFNPFDSGGYAPWGGEKIENVIGDVRVPKEKYLALGVTVESNLPLLLSLAPDSLNGLALGGTVLDEEDFYIDHLNGLKYLAWGTHSFIFLSFERSDGFWPVISLQSQIAYTLGSGGYDCDGHRFLLSFRSHVPFIFRFEQIKCNR